MKAGWQTKRLGDVCEIIKGRKPVLKANSSDGDLPYLVARVMRGSEEAQFASVKDRNSVLVAESETIIICDGSNSGEVFTGFQGILSSTMGKLSKKAEIDDDFLRAFLASTFEIFNGAKTGAAIPHLDKEAMYQLEFPLPPLPEQQRIVGILDEAFDGIATAKANAKKNLQNARELFENYLRAVFSQSGEGWVETTIGKHIQFIDYRGRTPEKTESGLRLITAKNVKMGYLKETPKEFVAPKSYERWMTRGIPRLGDVLFTTEAPLANVAQLDTDEKVVFAQRIIIMQPDAARIDSTFLKYLLLSPAVQQRIRDKGTGATVKGIKARLLKTIEISFPKSVADQKQLVVKLNALREETERLESIYQQKLTALYALKKSLLHQAFSGQL